MTSDDESSVEQYHHVSNQAKASEMTADVEQYHQFSNQRTMVVNTKPVAKQENTLQRQEQEQTPAVKSIMVPRDQAVVVEAPKAVKPQDPSACWKTLLGRGLYRFIHACDKGYDRSGYSYSLHH